MYPNVAVLTPARYAAKNGIFENPPAVAIPSTKYKQTADNAKRGRSQKPQSKTTAVCMVIGTGLPGRIAFHCADAPNARAKPITKATSRTKARSTESLSDFLETPSKLIINSKSALSPGIKNPDLKTQTSITDFNCDDSSRQTQVPAVTRYSSRTHSS